MVSSFLNQKTRVKMGRPRSFRLVCEPGQTGLVEALLMAEGYRLEPEPFSPFARMLVGEPKPLGVSLAAIFGYIYIQDRSSMLPPLALCPQAGQSALDMCASPGGKSGFLGQLAGRDGFVLANEPNRPRLGVLRANLRKTGMPWLATCSYPGESLPLFPGSWPMILLDAPCSGWGTEEKHPGIRQLWNENRADNLAALQRRLLRQAALLLEPGGHLLYSTCTTNPVEDERQTCFAEAVLGLERVPIKPFPGFVFEERPGGAGCLLVAGEKSRAQGFYLSLLRKPQEGAPFSPPDTSPPWRSATLELPATPVCDPSQLGHGDCAAFSGVVRFLPAQARRLPPEFVWQGARLGDMRETARGTVFSLDPRLRGLLPRKSAENRLVLEDVAEIRALLSGGARNCGLPGTEAALWWRDLPLGKVGLKNGRVIARFQD